MRGVTSLSTEYGVILDISIHTPHAGSDKIQPWKSVLGYISIHTPHAGSDLLGF